MGENQHRESEDSPTGVHDVLPTASGTKHEQTTGLEDTTIDPGRPRAWHTPMFAASSRLWKQSLGLNPFKGSYFGLYTVLNGHYDRIIAACGGLFAVAAGVPLPIIGVIFGKIISTFPPDEQELQTRIIQLLSVAVAYFVVTAAYTTIFSRTGERIAIQLRQRVLRTLIYVEQSYLDVQDLDFNALMRDNIDTIQVGCSEKIGIFIQSMSYFVAAFAVGFILNPKLTGILFAAVIPSMVAVVSFGSTSISKLTRRISEHTEKANTIVLSALRGIRVVQAFDMISNICDSHRQNLDECSRLGLRKAIASALELGGAYFVAYSANGLAFYVGSRMAAAGEAGGDAGTIYAVVFLILDASFVVGQFAPFLEIFARAAAAYGKVQGLLDACLERNGEGGRTPLDIPFDIMGKEVRFQNVAFAYPARSDVQVLKGLDLVLQPGTFNAIVGTSGGGKSTLVALLLRIYNYAGEIFIGSCELKSVDKARLRSQLAVLDQECVLFSGSIYDNICYGLVGRDVSKGEYAERCEQAAADAGIDFLPELSHGIHTKIDNTTQLSGGQRQRVCLARALIARPAILLLDEPTSALDARSEVKVMQAIRSAVNQGITVIMVAHRLSTVLGADHVVVVQDGRTVENGSPTELAADGTVFSALLAAQRTSLDAHAGEVEFEDISKSNSDAGSFLHDEESDERQQVKQCDEPADPSPVQLLRWIMRLVLPDSSLVIAGELASIISGGMIIGEAIIFGGLVQLLNSDEESPRFQEEANFYCLMFFVLACIALVSFVGSGTAFGIASSRLGARVQELLLDKVLHMDLHWFSRPGNSTTELASRFSKDSGDLACLSGVALGTVFTVIVSVFGGIILAHAIAWRIAIVLLSAVPIMLASGFIRLRLLAISERRHRTAYGNATALAVEVCHARRTVTTLGLEEFNLRRYHDALQQPYKAGLTPTIICNCFLAFSLAITYFVYALAYWWGAKQVRSGEYSQQEFFTVLPALLFSAQSAGQLFSLSPEIARAKTAAGSVFKMLATRPTILTHAFSESSASSEKSPLATMWRRLSANIDNAAGTVEVLDTSNYIRRQTTRAKIALRAVSFRYPGENKPNVLRDVSFEVHEGETVAIVGPSGAGKSSVISLFERFYDPFAGEILLENTNMRQHDVRTLRSRMSLLAQEPELFPGSIEYNIQLGMIDRTASLQVVEEMAKRCGIHDFVASLPEGYATECGAVANSQLSGGQRQRIALARALIRDPEILLLDEPTSALDAQSERHIYEALQAASKGRTTVIVAHRLASIRHVDKIIVLEGGRIVDQGTHAELLERGGLYASMAKAQALV